MSSKLKSLLSSKLTKQELALVVGSYDIVGDIAIIIIPEGLLHHKKIIGEAILGNNKNIKVVARRAGNYGGEFRTIDLEVIAGETRKETLLTEFGVRLAVNLETTYFSVRSGSERRRVASLVQPGEKVLVMFSGVGPYPLIIAKHSAAASVVGIEKNSLAHQYALKNLSLNKKIINVRFLQGDVAEIAASMDERFDRIVMPLPMGGNRFLGDAIELLTKETGGVIHYYEMAGEGDFDAASLRVKEACAEVGRELGDIVVTRCGHCGPRSYRICVDGQIL